MWKYSLVLLCLSIVIGCAARGRALTSTELEKRAALVRPVAKALRDSLVLTEEKQSATATVVLNMTVLRSQFGDIPNDHNSIAILSQGHVYHVFFSSLGRCVKSVFPSEGIDQSATFMVYGTTQCGEPKPYSGECIRFEVYICDDRGMTWSVYLDPEYAKIPVPHCGSYEPSLAQLRKKSQQRNCEQVPS